MLAVSVCIEHHTEGVQARNSQEDATMRRQLGLRGRKSGHSNDLTYDRHQQGALFSKRCAFTTVKYFSLLNRMYVVKE